MPAAPLPLTLTVHQTAALLGVGPRLVYQSIDHGDIPAVKLGQRTLVPVAWVADQLGVTPDQIQQSARETATP